MTFTLSELILAGCALTAAKQVKPRSFEAAIGFALLGITAAFGALLWLDLSVVQELHAMLTKLSGLWSIPLVGVGWVLVRHGEESLSSQARPAAIMIVLALLGVLIGGPWRTLAGVTAVLTILFISREDNPNHPRVRHGLLGGGLLLLGAALGSSGTWLGLDRVVWFHLLLAGGSLALASGLNGLPGSREEP